ncbi:MAG TPA: dihydropyrimidinase [Burkholderiales bacterium]|jgi:dihydropyrimidinase|nr:dihydropyrimidinase [Burkholderiales bacterium]
MELPDNELDLTIRNAVIVNASTTMRGDIGVRDGRIAMIADRLAPAAHDIDAEGRYVLPGGIDSHCHVEQLSASGLMTADDFYSATVSAAFGGTTTIIPFAAQHRGMSLPKVVEDYHACAGPKAVIDYSFHLIVSDPTPQALAVDLPELIRKGYTSFKVYMTYDKLKLDDGQLLDVLDLAGRAGALVMVHAENNDVIKWIAQRLLANGHGAPKFHAVAHDPLAESEATHRVIQFSRLLDTPVLVVHVSGIEAVRNIRAAQTLGVRVYGETCPQYLFLTAKDIDRPGLDGAMFCCSPPPRDAASQEAVWEGLTNGTFQVYSSDHAPYRFDESGKLPKGDKTTFKDMANGVPGLELRLPLLFSEGVLKGRMTIKQFVALTATNHAQMYGLAHRKGAIAVGLDADMAIWDAEKATTITAANIHDNVGYTPYEGREITGWPVTVINRGRVVVENGELRAERGSGNFIARKTPGPLRVDRKPSAQMRLFKSLISTETSEK